MKTTKNVLVAAAWPYANGSLHLGHAASLLGGDIIARYSRSHGHNVLFVSGSDCHGTPIVLEAQKQGVHPQEISERYHAEFRQNLTEGLAFSYDIYTKTTTPNHHKVVKEIFLSLLNRGFIYTKSEKHPYCNTCKRFLPDRYIEGECPICHFDNARGDQCDECGNLLDADQLLKPKCKICGNPPESRPSEHFYLRLSAFEKQLKEWVNGSSGWRMNAKKFTLSLLEGGLHDRAITRDTEWGVPIPLEGYDGKSIYVWFEAVCGYLAASKEWADLQGRANLWEPFWTAGATHYYLHGKDNILFHTVIWPAMILGAGNLHLPDRIYSSEYLTLEKRQFSKSRGWAVLLGDFLREFEAETLRYYLIANGPETADADFSWENYRSRTNNELISIFGNYIHRILSFVKTNFPEGVCATNDKLNDEQTALLDHANRSFDAVGQTIEEGRFRDGIRLVLDLASHGNRFINNAAPWFSIKQDRKKAEADLAVAVTSVACLAILVAPFLPRTAERISKTINIDAHFVWTFPKTQAVWKVSEKPQPLFRKIDDEAITKQLLLLTKP